jgi:hypothetical protein
MFAEMSAVSGRFLFICGALLVFANVACGDGTYQRTKNGKTFVWNSDPKPGDEATWSGDRDREGYARGFGTLTWHTAQRNSEAGSAKSALYARYWGNMVRGKFNGPVNVHSKGKTGYAIFADGVRTTRWSAGPAPSWRVAQQRSKLTKPEAAAEPASAKRSGVAEPEAPAEGSPPAQTSEVRGHMITDRPVNRAVPKPGANKNPKAEVDDSLRLLFGPPSSLRKDSIDHASSVGPKTEAAPLPEANPRLTKSEVIDLAEAEARRRGYDAAEYQRAEPQYNAADETWSLSFDQHAVAGAEEAGKNFSITVDDKTKGTVFVPGK